jgi:hypothetical protein
VRRRRRELLRDPEWSSFTGAAGRHAEAADAIHEYIEVF